MKKGVCIYFNGIQRDECDKAVNYRKLVGGEDKGWVNNLPCLEIQKTTIVCNEMKWPTSEEIEEDEEKRYQAHLDAWAEKDI